MSVHSVSMKGKRARNEDKHEYILNLDENYDTYDPTKAPINFYAIFDGHGGQCVSKFLHQNLSQYFMCKEIAKYPLQIGFVEKIYAHLENKLKMNKQTENCGSTCLIVIHYRDGNSEKLDILNTGDSRAIICSNNMAIPLTHDHKPNVPSEKKRIQKLGGTISWDGYDWRICDLSLSRSFGDFNAKKYVTSNPDIYRRKLTKGDKFFVLGCDGLYDCLTNEEIVNFILDKCYDMETGQRINKNINIAKKLGEYAINQGSTDNVTALVVFLS